MKTIQSVCLLMLLLFSLNISARERTIDRPPFIGWNGTIIEIDKIVLNDASTVFHIKAFFTPHYWIMVDPETYIADNDGNKYTIVSAEGITMGEQFWMPESGETEFILTFPPVPEGVKTLDFSEGEHVEGGWNIWGISLDGKLPELVFPKDMPISVAASAQLPEVAIRNGKAKLSGQILEYNPGMGETIMLYMMGSIGMHDEIRVPVNPDGTFAADVPAYSVTPAALMIGNHVLELFLAPGEETTLYVNTREMARRESRLRKDEPAYGETSYYDGFMAGISTEMASHSYNVTLGNDHRAFLVSLKDKNVTEIRDYILNWREETLAEINKMNISEASKQILRMRCNLSVLDNITWLPGLYKRAYLFNNDIQDEAEAQAIFDMEVESPEVGNDLFAQFSDFNTPDGLYTPYLGRVTLTNKELIDKMAKAWGTDKGIFFDIATANKILSDISEFQPVTEAQLATLKSLPSAYTEIVNTKNKELLHILEANKKKTGFRMNEVGDVANEELFASIIAPFRGKTILVDFWATWCGPCRMANKMMAPMKEDLKDKDIVYLYIAGENSPEGTWQNMLTDIPGEHIRVNADQWDYLSKTYKVEGVPTYMVVDKEGNITFKAVGFPGVDSMKAELEKAHRQ